MHGSLKTLAAHPAIVAEEYRGVGYRGKRRFDIVGAALLIVLTAPISLLVYVAVRCSSPGPAIFRQTRVGQDGKLFNIVKFRTLHVGTGTPYDLVLRSDPRLLTVTLLGKQFPVGKWLRQTHLDELPQLYNVLRTEMSLVGPRPDMPERAAQRLAGNSRHRKLLRHKPGLVGPVCLSGKWEEREAADPSFNATDEELKYFAHESLSKNLRLLARVPAKLFVRRRSYAC